MVSRARVFILDEAEAAFEERWDTEEDTSEESESSGDRDSPEEGPGGY